jgi:hypothetical protein
MAAMLAGCGNDCPAPSSDEESLPDPFVTSTNFVVHDENGCAYLVQIGDSYGYGRRPVRWGGRLPYADQHPQTGPGQDCGAVIKR